MEDIKGLVFGHEPVVLLRVITAALSLSVLFGLDLTPEVTAGIIAMVEATFILLARQSVTPVDYPHESVVHKATERLERNSVG